jgi:hypothetical protein
MAAMAFGVSVTEITLYGSLEGAFQIPGMAVEH